MRVAACAHAVFCKDTRAVLRIDLILESTGSASVWRGRAAKKSHLQGNAGQPRCYLASVHACSGGRDSRSCMSYAVNYMRGVQAVCNRDMNFFPRVMVMRVRQGSVGGGGTRVCARDVSM